jgi:D-3-phosphoglycerate dehydrogenase
MYKVLVTCPPMLGQIEHLRDYAAQKNIELIAAKVNQTLSEEELKLLLPGVNGWIIGDDQATHAVLSAGKAGLLKAAVKWGIGIDNVDFKACEALAIPIDNTPNMFGKEVADLALGYVIGLARQTFLIDRNIRQGNWLKPAGMSLAGKKVGVVGFGDIGSNLSKRLHSLDMQVIVYDPYVNQPDTSANLEFADYPNKLDECDLVIFTCALNPKNTHMLNSSTLSAMKKGVFIINVARGALIDEQALISALQSGHVAGAALDVFEIEPLPSDSTLLQFEQCILGSHNASNTIEAAHRASLEAIDKIGHFLHGS